jgi:hypothetical protein
MVKSIYEAEERIKMLLGDTKLRKTMSDNARKTSLRFKSDILAFDMIDLYKKILDKK